jgi:hypothetical protein
MESSNTGLRKLTPAELDMVSSGVVPPRAHINLCDHGGPLCGASPSNLVFAVAGALIGGLQGFLVGIL